MLTTVPPTSVTATAAETAEDTTAPLLTTLIDIANGSLRLLSWFLSSLLAIRIRDGLSLMGLISEALAAPT